MARGLPEAEILIRVDQAVELFTEADPLEAGTFFSRLSAALGSGTRPGVEMTLPSDVPGWLQGADGLGVLLWEVSLSPLSRDRLAERTKGKAQVAGLRYEDAFVPSLACTNEPDNSTRRQAHWSALPPRAWPQERPRQRSAARRRFIEESLARRQSRRTTHPRRQASSQQSRTCFALPEADSERQSH